MDPGYRRLRYCRYADDFMIGVIGSKEDARSVFAEVRAFLTEALALTVTANSGQSHAVVRTDSKLQPFCVMPAEEGLPGAIELQVVVL
jgi:hypothetical protein